MSSPEKTYYRHPDSPLGPGKLAGAIRCGDWIYVSGQGPLDMSTAKYIPGTVREETQMTLECIEKILQQAGASRKDIVKCTGYLANLDDFAEYHETFKEFFGDPLPCRTTVRADLLRGIQVEIDAVAFSPQS